MNECIRTAIYCRLSEEDKNKQNAGDDSGSIQNQKAMLRDYCTERGWEIYGIYSDDDYTGADRTRPAFRRLLADAEARRFDVVLCKTQSRFTREIELVERYIHGLFPLWGIRFVSIVDNADTADRGNKKSRQINALVNEWYLEDLSENIRSALDIRRKNGYHIGSFALYGYRKDPNVKGHLLIDVEAAAVVKEVFTLFDKGYGKTAIARILNDRGIPNPTEYKRMQGLRYQHPSGTHGTLWRYSAISDMLTNEIYLGNMVQGKYGSVSYKTSKSCPRPREAWYVVKGTHEAIIDRALWDRVARRISERAKPFSDGEIGLFAGKARCASCGYVLRSSKSGGRRYLQCPSRYLARGACAGAFISEDRLKRAVEGELARLNGTYLDREELLRSVELDSGLRDMKEQIGRELDACRGRLGTYEAGVRELYVDKVSGIIAKSDFIALSLNLTAERDRLRERVLMLEGEMDEIIKQLDEDAADRARRIEACVDGCGVRRETVAALIDRIMVGVRIPGTRTVPIEIHWSF